MAARPGFNQDAQPGSLLLAVHGFVARSHDELSLAKGDRLELIEKDDDFGDGWFLGRHMGNAKTGLFPEVYTRPAPKGTIRTISHQRQRSDGPPKTPQGSEAVVATSPTQQRPSSSATVDQRPASAQQSTASPMAQIALRTYLPLATPPSMTSVNEVSSPVMTETLSVIAEHMNDMNAPVNPFTNGENRSIQARTSSLPTSQPLAPFPYIAGHETDEEEHQIHTEEEVAAWTPERVAEYLEDNGVEKAHCDIFKDQEISGEVLLAMEQSSIFLKEFELGSVGRRLKTWHKVRALQEEVRTNVPPKVARSTSDYSAITGDDQGGEASRNRASTMGSILPRALETGRQSIAAPGRSNTGHSLSQVIAPLPSPGLGIGPPSPLQHITSISRQGSTMRPSAQSIRQMQHHRHSSYDSVGNSPIEGSLRQDHRKQPSFDRDWQLGQPQTNGNATGHSHALSTESAAAERQSLKLSQSASEDFDRGYFSSNELDSRASNRKSALSKKLSTAASPMHSRNSSYVNKRRSTQSGRFSNGSYRESASQMGGSFTAAQGIFGALNAVGNTYDNMRSMTTPQLGREAEKTNDDILSPVVTKLDYSDQSLNEKQNGLSRPKMPSSPTNTKTGFFSQAKPRMSGLRAISDAITRHEVTSATISPAIREGPAASPARTGSTTPSTEAQSIDLQKSEVQSRTSASSATNLVLPPTSQRRPRIKAKKATSAYTRGLEKKTPAEQLVDCDYSGWMKKKSGSLMTTWKTRLFVLKGRRLSYYYTDMDTEEKGLIDISFHRVLPAHNETITGLHATFTGAVGSPISPKDSTTSTTVQEDIKQSPAVERDNNVFIFKLVPPRTGLSKGVTFTKPTVHYFAVDSRQAGRLWMAALMKATIDRDEDGMVTTTYNQKTISLKKARARKERPPALREDDMEHAAELEGADDDSGKGLGIGYLSEKIDTVAGAEREKDHEDGSSFAPSTAATGTESDVLNEKERDP